MSVGNPRADYGLSMSDENAFLSRGDLIVSRIMNLTGRFYNRLPVRRIGADEQLHLLNREVRKRLRSVQWKAMMLAATLSVIGFLTYYL
ncbi:MAG TPA: hypothetical protein VID27_12840, partial [Blastocatellia bacterium]